MFEIIACSTSFPRKFVKKVESIPSLDFGFSSSAKKNVTTLKERGLIGNFIGIWRSYISFLELNSINEVNHDTVGIFYCENSDYAFSF